jgi:2'-5' RNA ligase
MQKFTQKWCIVAFMEPVAEGRVFDWKQWPLHTTLAGVFAVDWDAHDLESQLEYIASTQSIVEVTATTDVYWGAGGEYHVMLLEKTPALLELHMKIHALLYECGAVLNDPEFAGDGFVPHSTMQQHAYLKKGEKALLTSFSIIDMFPDQDGYKRKVVRTLPFGRAH